MKFQRILISGALLVGSYTTAYGQSLFNDMALDDEHIRGFTNIEGAFRSRQVTINQNTFDDFFQDTDISKSIKVGLFPGVNIDLERTDLDKRFGDGTKSWSGKVRGFENGFATFVSTGAGRMIGHVQYGNQTFRITPSFMGIHTISEISMQSMPEEEEIDFIRAPSTKPNSGRISTSAWPPVIDVLVMYTPAAVAEAAIAGTSAKDEALLALSMAKTTMVNSGLKTHRFRWRGYRGFAPCSSYGPQSSTSTVLNHITSASGGTDECMANHANKWRNALGADLVAVVKGSGGCGVAWYSPGGVSERYGFSVTSRACIGQHTFTHEIGHNLGLLHDRYQQGNEGSEQTAFNYGMTYPTRSTPVRTIMAYNSKCSASGVFCTRVPVFSNTHPKGLWDEKIMGRGLHLVDPAVSRKAIVQNWRRIAAFR